MAAEHAKECERVIGHATSVTLRHVDELLSPTMTLTPRLRDVLLLVAEGKTTAEIARDLGLSRNTVKNYIDRIFERLGVQDRVQAVSTALRLGLIH